MPVIHQHANSRTVQHILAFLDQIVSYSVAQSVRLRR